MMPSALAHPLLLLISVVNVARLLIRPRYPRGYWIGARHALHDPSRPGALPLAGRAAAKGSDVYFFLIAAP